MSQAYSTLLTRLGIGLVVLLVLSTAGLRTHADDEIRVWVESGRDFSGYVDQRTDDNCLWLRLSATRIEVIRPITWERITGVDHDGKRLSATELKQLASELKSPSPLEASRSRHIEGNRIVMTGRPEASTETSDHQSRASHPAAGPVRSVDFDAQIANWDGDVEPDGLRVRIYPLDADGVVTPVNGTLSVELITPRRRDFSQVPHGRGMSIDRIGRWSRSIRHKDLGASGIVLKLPFQATHPEFDSDVWNHGFIHLRLVVPGHGVFEDSVDGVRIRQFAPIRDQMQLSTGHRHFANERTGRSKRYQHRASNR